MYGWWSQQKSHLWKVQKRVWKLNSSRSRVYLPNTIYVSKLFKFAIRNTVQNREAVSEGGYEEIKFEEEWR